MCDKLPVLVEQVEPAARPAKAEFPCLVFCEVADGRTAEVVLGADGWRLEERPNLLQLASFRIPAESMYSGRTAARCQDDLVVPVIVQVAGRGTHYHIAIGDRIAPGIYQFKVCVVESYGTVVIAVGETRAEVGRVEDLPRPARVHA